MRDLINIHTYLHSLEVIPGDAYQVEKSGDLQTGFVTKVVFTKKESEQEKKNKERKSKTSNSGKPISKEREGEAALSKKERQKLKRKAKEEAAKERKRLKKTQEGNEVEIESAADKEQTEPQNISDTTAVDDSIQQEIERLQTAWSISATGVTLHTTLCTGLHSLKYTNPTPIQSATLPAAILGRRDIVGAAPTGSGKTLSFGLPILQYLLDETDKQKKIESQHQKLPLQALILTPTRELALQVAEELRRASCNKVPIGTIVGGFAEVKQKRILEKTRPPLIVATPGRLWELVSFLFLLLAVIVVAWEINDDTGSQI